MHFLHRWLNSVPSPHNFNFTDIPLKLRYLVEFVRFSIYSSSGKTFRSVSFNVSAVWSISGEQHLPLKCENFHIDYLWPKYVTRYSQYKKADSRAFINMRLQTHALAQAYHDTLH